MTGAHLNHANVLFLNQLRDLPSGTRLSFEGRDFVLIVRRPSGLYDLVRVALIAFFLGVLSWAALRCGPLLPSLWGAL